MGRNRGYPRDPYWMTTKYPTKVLDGSIVPAGTRAFYYPNSRTFLFGEFAEAASSKFEAERQDEAAYAAEYG